MNLSDIALLLGFVGIYDLRVQVDELKVRAWAESLDSDMTLAEAKKIVSFQKQRKSFLSITLTLTRRLTPAI